MSTSCISSAEMINETATQQAPDQPQVQNSQAQKEVRLGGGLKRITSLNLEEKSDLLKDSVFGDLSRITHSKESSPLLLSALYRSYDADKGVFVFNDEASFSFCSKEIAEVTGMRDSGMSLKEYEEGLVDCPKHFPKDLVDLRDKLVSGAAGKIKAIHIQKMLMGMSVGDDKEKKLFKQLMIYYLIEEVLLCQANSTKVPRAKTWQLVVDIEKCETVNWPKAIEQHLRGALVGCKDWEKNGCIVEKSFEGCMPVLEAVIYNRIRKIQPRLSDKKSHESPQIQKYKGQRKRMDIVLKALKASDIDPCPHCTSGSQDSGSQDSGSQDSGSQDSGSSSVVAENAEDAETVVAENAEGAESVVTEIANLSLAGDVAEHVSVDSPNTQTKKKVTKSTQTKKKVTKRNGKSDKSQSPQLPRKSLRIAAMKEKPLK